MRVVLDTNILARVASSPLGPAGDVYNHLRGEHLLVTSIPILQELERVLKYPRLRALHGLSDESVRRFVDAIATSSLVVSLPEVIEQVVPDDPDDDMLVATAVTGTADVLCTRNRHLYHPRVLAYSKQNEFAIMDELGLIQLLR